MAVITIAREFGAGGESVGQLLASRLRADLLDRSLIEEVARRLGLSDAEVEPHDESPHGLLDRILTNLGLAPIDLTGAPEVAWTPPYDDPRFDPREAILRLTQEVIRESARAGNAVIVGRGGAYVLAGHDGATHVFLRAPHSSRLAAVMESRAVSEERARREIKQTDANRAAYIRQVYGHDWAHPSHYHLVLDTHRLGYERCVDTILAAAGLRTGIC